MPKFNRRKAIVGIGMLATGSGAAFTSAAFNNRVDATGDMRVVAAEDLTIEPGISFRDGSNAGDPYDSSLDGSSSNFYSGSNNDFFSVSSPTTGGDDDLGGDLGPGDLPAISVSDNVDGNLVIKVATLNSASVHTFPEVLQIRNDGDTNKQVSVKYETFGADTQGDMGQGGTVNTGEVVDAYSFLDSNTNIISTDYNHFNTNTISGVTDQKVANTVTVGAGAVEQVDLEVDLNSTIVSEIASASNAGGNPFSGDRDTVQLVDTVRFGTGDETSP
jgi:hypothetical protein